MPKNKSTEPKSLSKSALRRMREREQRLQTISKAAENLFVQNGYHQTSMEQIADASEVSVGSVYFYFKNKEDLLIHLNLESAKYLRLLLGQAFQSAKTPLDGIRNAGLVFFEDFCLNHTEKMAILFKESVGQSNLLETQRKKMLDKLTKDVELALIDVSNDLGFTFPHPYTAGVIAVCVLGIYERVAYQYLIWKDHDEDWLSKGKEALDFIIGGIQHIHSTAKTQFKDA